MNTEFKPFSSTYIEFEQVSEGVTASAFGVLNLCVNKFPITSQPLSVSLMIDHSGSMSYKCSDGASQQAHVNFAADKVLRYLQNHGVDAHISVSAFDDKVDTIVKPQQLSQENVEEISKKISTITPDGGTNIYSVLDLESKWEQDPSSTKKRIFFLFTDGQPTSGRETRLLELIAKARTTIHPDTTIVALGCGVNHSSYLLKGIADRKRGVYKFVGDIEEISFACGEILDGILNDVVEDCEIEVNNGQIWDWKKNDWVSKIVIRNIVGECNKTYHVMSLTPSTFSALFTGVAVETRAPHKCIIDDIRENVDVRKHKYRQETLELLHETNKKYEEDRLNGNTKVAKELKQKLTEFVVRMKAFMDDNDLREDIFMKMLCDDIFVCYNAIGTHHGYMYTQSRQTSQATQGIHTNTCVVTPPPTMRRGLGQTIPLCSRQVTESIDMMLEDFEDNEELVGAPPRTPIISRWPTMQPVYIDEDVDLHDYGQTTRTPKQVRHRTLSDHLKDNQEEEDEDSLFNVPPPAMTRHVSMSSYVSPYSNEKTMSVIREVSVGSSYKGEEEAGKELP